MGKTQIALELSFRIQELRHEASMFCLPAGDASSFQTGYREIGRQLEIPRVDDKVNVKELVNTRLAQESTGKKMMKSDNADHFEPFYKAGDDGRGPCALDYYLPITHNGSNPLHRSRS